MPEPGDVSTCRHCGERIVFRSARFWTHLKPGAPSDLAHTHCHQTIAEPEEAGRA